jgi:hypothetical protein
VTVLVLQRVKISFSLRSYCKDKVMGIVGNGFLLGTQGTSCFKPRKSPESSPLRSHGSRDDQAEEAGPVEHSSAEAKSLKLEAKRLACCHPSRQQPRQSDGEARGQIKDYFHDNL